MFDSNPKTISKSLDRWFKVKYSKVKKKKLGLHRSSSQQGFVHPSSFDFVYNGTSDLMQRLRSASISIVDNFI